MSQDRDHHDLESPDRPAAYSRSAEPGKESRSGKLRRSAHPVPSALSGLRPAPAVHERSNLGSSHSTVDPAWVRGARSYNAAHADLVAEFNELTHQECLDDTRQLSAQKVAAWQAARSLLADGKVGPLTVAAAQGRNRPNNTAPLEGAPAAHAMFEKARAFHAAHPELVAEFNELTAYFCFDFERNELVPEAVAKWQIRHSEPADGMVMPDTIAAAKKRLTGVRS